MFKKATALLFLTIAYAILLGHSIIPHHHHVSEHELVEHHQSHHHHNSESHDSEDISHLLSHFVHAADGFILTKNNSVNHVYFPLIAILPPYFSTDDIFIPPIKPKANAINVFYISPQSIPAGLRAPPVFFS